MNKVEIPIDSGNFYRYGYVDGTTVYRGPVGDGPALTEAEFLKQVKRRLTQADVRTIAKELETGQGGLLKVAEKHPWLVDLSRSNLGDDPITLYRVLFLGDEEGIKEERVVSTTTDPSVALNMKGNQVISGNRLVLRRPVLLRYDIPLERVHLHVPTVIEEIEKIGSDLERMKVETRYGEKMSVASIFRQVKQEEEVFADVSFIPVTSTIRPNKTHLKILADEIMDGNIKQGDDYAKKIREVDSSHYFDQREKVELNNFAEDVFEFIS